MRRNIVWKYGLRILLIALLFSIPVGRIAVETRYRERSVRRVGKSTASLPAPQILANPVIT